MRLAKVDIGIWIKINYVVVLRVLALYAVTAVCRRHRLSGVSADVVRSERASSGVSKHYLGETRAVKFTVQDVEFWKSARGWRLAGGGIAQREKTVGEREMSTILT